MNTIIKPLIEIKPAIMEESEEKGIIIVHCTLPVFTRARIWRSTYLIDAETGFRNRMLHAENITLYPVIKQFYGPADPFTLYFEALPKSCRLFHLHEIIPEPGGWLVENIERNNEDVYHINL